MSALQKILTRFLALSALAMPSIALAADDVAKESSGLPQLDVSFYFGQVFWLIVFFSAFVFIVTRVAIPNIASAQQSRSELLESELKQAQEANAATEKLRSEYKSHLASAQSEAHRIVDSAFDMAQKSIGKKVGESRVLINERIARAEDMLASRRKDAMQHVESESQKIASIIVNKIMSQTPRRG